MRNSTKTDITIIRTYIEAILQGLDFSLILSESARPFVTCKDSLIVQKLSETLLHVKGSLPKLSTAGGTSDARFFGSFGIATVECGVVNDTIHSTNEHCPLHEVDSLVTVFKNVIENFKKEDV